MAEEETNRNKPGRPTVYNATIPERIYKLCLLGATGTEIANILGIAESTLNLWKNEYPELMESIKRGKEDADANVANRLYKRAMGYVTKDTIYATKDGEITDKQEIDKHYPPDVTAAIFWLKNRQGKKWRDKQELDLSGEVSIQLEGNVKDWSK